MQGRSREHNSHGSSPLYGRIYSLGAKAFRRGNRKAAAKNGKTPMEYAKELEDAIVEKIYRENIEIYKGHHFPYVP